MPANDMPHSDSEVEESTSEYEYASEVESTSSEDLEDELVSENEEVSEAEEEGSEELIWVSDSEEEGDQEEEEESDEENDGGDNDVPDMKEILKEHGALFAGVYEKLCIILATQLPKPLVPGLNAQDAFYEWFWEHVWNEQEQQ